MILVISNAIILVIYLLVTSDTYGEYVVSCLKEISWKNGLFLLILFLSSFLMFGFFITFLVFTIIRVGFGPKLKI